MTAELAIDNLKAYKKACGDAGLKESSKAFQMGAEALETINPMVGKPKDYKPTNAEVLISILAKVVQNGADEDGFSNVVYEEIVYLTQAIRCPYTNHPLCALDDENQDNEQAYKDCDACKDHWLMEKWEE